MIASFFKLERTHISVAIKSECPIRRKVKMSLSAATRHEDPARSDRLIRLQDQIGAGDEHSFSFSFETI
ncbi:hypothetical protein CCGE531_21970 (plasmid) [Rhizobium sp. CCGE531]|nr:hypothetical protein CCGE531_21970 [Rhizobium sp. CCGE531]AYG75144.1 hypothetical protein CCGE532_21445 [Rhizobium sp. CCGE532]